MAWIAAIIGAAGSASASSKAKKAQKKGQKGAAAQLAASQGRLSPYADIGKAAQYQLANLMGISGYGSPEEIELTGLREPQLTDFTSGLKLSKEGKFLEKLGAVKGMGVEGYKATRYAKKKDSKARKKYAAAVARHKKALEDFEVKKAQLTDVVARQKQSGEIKTGGDLMDRESVKFRLGEGRKMTEAGGSARADLLSGEQKRRLQEVGQGIASQEYGAEFNRLAHIASGGQAAAGYQGGIGQGLANLSLMGGQTGADYYGNLNQALQGTIGNINYAAQRDNTSTVAPLSTGSGSQSPVQTEDPWADFDVKYGT